MVSENDAARKYLPKSKETGSVGSTVPSLEHGTFTQISYVIAWATAILGTLAGLLLAVQGFSYNGDITMVGSGIAVLIAAWVSASGIGTLAEISRKLSDRSA